MMQELAAVAAAVVVAGSKVFFPGFHVSLPVLNIKMTMSQ